MVKTPAFLEEVFPRWESLTSEQQAHVKKYTEEQRFLKGQSIHQGGRDCAGLCIVKDGQLRVFILSESGREVTLYRLFAWDICLFSASCVMQNISFDVQVEAEKDTDVFLVPADIYEGLMRSSLPVADYTNRLISARFSDVMSTMERILFTRVDSRLAAFLLEQSTIEDTEVLKITHDEIARHMGSAREVITKALNYLANEGLVKLSRGRVTLLDEDGLQNLSE